MAFWFFGLLREFSSSFSSLISYSFSAHYFSMIFFCLIVGVYEAAMPSSQCECRGYPEETEVPTFSRILYIMIRLFIFSSAFLLRFPRDSLNRVFIASFNRICCFRHSITLILACKASLPIARAPLPRWDNIFLNNSPRKLSIPWPRW